MEHAKKYVEAAKKILPNALYPVDDTFRLVRKTSVTKFDVAVEVVMRLNVDPRRADQPVRDTTNLPHDIGKTMRVLVFAVGEKVADAQAAGADEVGDDELTEKVSKGYIGFDVAVATPDLMNKVGRLGRVLGPRGLMLNLKTGTMTMDVTKAVKDIKGGRIEFRVDRHANLRFAVGKVSFGAEKLAENHRTVFEEVMHLCSSTVKGRYITKAMVPTTMGPPVPLALAEKKEAQGHPRIKA